MKKLRNKPDAINLFAVVKNVGPLGAGACLSSTNVYRSLRMMGMPARVFKIGKRTENTVRTPSKGGYPYQNLALEDAIKLVEKPKQLSLIVHMTGDKGMKEPTIELIKAGCPCFLRASKDICLDFVEAWTEYGSTIITIRERIRALLEEEYDLEATCVPHVYLPQKPKRRHRKYNAVSIARVAGNKKIDMLVEANQRLPRDKRIHIFGVESRQYTHFYLDEKMPEWRKQYHGEFPIGTGASIAAQSHYVVDMSDMGVDGGGTQNTFFEAWEAGCVLVINRKWHWEHGSIQPNEHAIYVGSVKELVRVLKRPADPGHFKRHVKALMARHRPEVIIPRLMRAIGGRV